MAAVGFRPIFERFDARKRGMNVVKRSAIAGGQVEFTFEHGFRNRTKRGYEKELCSLSTGVIQVLRVGIFRSRRCARLLKLATRSRRGSEEIFLFISRNLIHRNGYGPFKILAHY